MNLDLHAGTDSDTFTNLFAPFVGYVIEVNGTDYFLEHIERGDPILGASGIDYSEIGLTLFPYDDETGWRAEEGESTHVAWSDIGKVVIY